MILAWVVVGGVCWYLPPSFMALLEAYTHTYYKMWETWDFYFYFYKLIFVICLDDNKGKQNRPLLQGISSLAFWMEHVPNFHMQMN